MLSNIVNIGVVGAGKLGTYHIQKLLDKSNCNFIGIYDSDLDIMKSHKNKYNICLLYTSDAADDS